MAIVRSVRKLLKKDFKDSPEWFGQFLAPFNQFMDSTVGALRNNLSFKDNFLGEVKEYVFTHATELEISHELEQFNGIIIIKGPEATPATTYGISEYHARVISNDTVGVTIEFAAATIGGDATEGIVKLILLG